MRLTEIVMRSTIRPKTVTILRSLSILLVFMCFAANSASALDPSRPISQFAHTDWKTQNGFLNGMPTAITQTADGYLWIGTRSGLTRFDGVRFIPWSSLSGKQLPSSDIESLLGARDGSLWIGTHAGLGHWVNQDLASYPDITEPIAAIVETRDGKIWFSPLQRSEPAAGICEVADSGTHCYGKADGIPVEGGPLLEDVKGNLWAGDPTKVIRWRPGSSDTYSPKGLKSNAGSGVTAFAVTSAGSFWVGMEKAGPGLGLQQLDHGKWKPFVTSEFDSSFLVVSSLLLDRNSCLWIGTGGDGLYRICGKDVDRYRSTDGLSGDGINALFEDREGTIWVATTGGIDSFHEIRVTTFSFPKGTGSEETDAVLATRGGTVWVGRPQSLDALRDGKVVSLQTKKGLPGNQVTALLEDHAGRVWVGIDQTLSIYKNGKFVPINRSDGRPIGPVVDLAEDVQHDVWAETMGSPRILFRIRDFKVREEFSAEQIPAAHKIAADPIEGIWLGLMSGDLARFRQGRIELFSYPHGPNPIVKQLTVMPDGSVLAATTAGLIAWRNGKQQTLAIGNGLPCENIFAQIFDGQKALWLYAECGLIKITDAELQKWWERPDTRLQVEVLDLFDGARTGSAPFDAAARTPDGRLWFVNGVLLQMIDPAHTSGNAVPPPVQIEGLIADHKSYPLRGAVHLGPLAHDLEIDYTALSFVVPQKVRFRYKLEGRDAVWQEPGTRRQAFYNDLHPGNYRFRVIACNNDDVWNDTGATLDFSIAPAWYQTAWFRLVCLACVVFIAWLLHRVRVRQIATGINARFDERLAERTRIARDLHDTFVQTIQGSKLVADDALEQTGDPVRMRRAMEQLSVWLGQATQEGRAALNSLRTSTTQTNDLAAALRRVTEDGLIPKSLAVTFSVSGDVREMHPIVRDEIFRIGYEAIRNACMHSGASQMGVEIRYADDLALRVKDNGSGMDKDAADRGRDGHFGIRGMRERAERIRGKLTLISSPKSGTEVKLVVPGDIIFQPTIGAQETLLGYIKTRFRRRRRVQE